MSDDEKPTTASNEEEEQHDDEDEENEGDVMTLQQHNKLSEENKAAAMKAFFSNTKEFIHRTEDNGKTFIIRCTGETDCDMEDIGYVWPMAFIDDFGTAHSQTIMASIHFLDEENESLQLVGIATVSDKYCTSTFFYKPDFAADLDPFLTEKDKLNEIVPGNNYSMHFDNSEAPCSKDSFEAPLLDQMTKTEYNEFSAKYNPDSALLKSNEDEQPTKRARAV